MNVAKIYIDIEGLICHIDYTVVTNLLAEWYYSWGSGFDPLWCRIFNKKLMKLRVPMLWEIYDMDCYTVMDILYAKTFDSKCTSMHHEYDFSSICFHDFMIKDVIIIPCYLGQPWTNLRGISRWERRGK